MCQSHPWNREGPGTETADDWAGAVHNIKIGGSKNLLASAHMTHDFGFCKLCTLQSLLPIKTPPVQKDRIGVALFVFPSGVQMCS